MDKLNIGFIGVGHIADLHHLGYRDDHRAMVYAICDSDEHLLRRRAAEWGVERVYHDYRELLDDPSVDIVDVITPHHLHAEMVIAALDAGKHVSVQKPMSLNLTEADAMVECANRSDGLFRVIENYRFHTPVIKAKEIIDTGGIGDPISMRMKSISGKVPDALDPPLSSKEWRSDTELAGEGSFVFDHGHHMWALARYFMGDVESVFAFIGRKKVDKHFEMLPGSILDSPAVVTWKYAGHHRYGSWEGVDAHGLAVPSNKIPLDAWVEVTGTEGIIWVNRVSSGHILERAPLELYRDGELKNYVEYYSDYRTSFRGAISNLIDAVLGIGEADLTGEEARDVLRFSLAVLRSGQQHREVRVDEDFD